MQLNNSNNINFTSLYMHENFYNTAAELNQGPRKEEYRKAIENLNKASKGDEITIMGSDGSGNARIVRTEGKRRIVDYIVQEGEAIDTINRAAIRLNNEAEAKEKKPVRERFKGTKSSLDTLA